MAHSLIGLVVALGALGACGGDTGASADAGTDTSTSTSADTSTDTSTSTDTTDEDTGTSTDTSTSTSTDATDEDTSTSTDATDEDTSADASDTASDVNVEPGPDLAGPCPLADRFGGFQAVDDGEYGYVDGTISDAVLPVSVLDVVTSDGPCTLYRKTNPFCSPPCGPSETCDRESHCVAYPAPQDLGRVTVTGLAGAVAMDPVQPGNLYFATDVPYPPWTPGDLVTLDIAGGALAPLSLDGVAPVPLVAGDATWTLTAGTALEAHWDAPAGPVRSRVELQLLIDQHGNAPASLRCDFDDTGSGMVPAALVDALLGLGVSGFPSGKLVRQTVDSAALTDAQGQPLAGCADFAVRTPRAVKVTVAGHIPCKKNLDCPNTMHCDLPTETCVPN